MFEFNFLIIFRLNKQNIKANNLIRKIENFFVNKENERKIHNRKQLLKKQIFKQRYTQDCRINVNVVKRVNEKRYLINCINLQLKQKKIC